MILLVERRGMLSVNRKRYVMDHIMPLRLLNTLKSSVFRETSKKCLIDSTLLIKLSWKVVMWEVIWDVEVIVEEEKLILIEYLRANQKEVIKGKIIF